MKGSRSHIIQPNICDDEPKRVEAKPVEETNFEANAQRRSKHIIKEAVEPVAFLKICDLVEPMETVEIVKLKSTSQTECPKCNEATRAQHFQI